MFFQNIAIAKKAKFGDGSDAKMWQPFVQCPVSGTEYIINVPKVECTCVTVDNTVSITKSSLR